MKSLSSALALCLLSALSQAQTYVYEQPMVSGGGVLRSSQFWVDPSGQNDSDNDSICWENFELPAAISLTKLRWWGQAGLPLGFRIAFFHQDPNTIAIQPDIFSGPFSEHDYSTVPQVSAGGGMYRFDLDLVAPISIAANTRYFVSVVALTPNFSQQWSWAQGSGGTYGTFWWIRGAHMYFHTGEDRALALGTAAGGPIGTASCFGDGSAGPCPCGNSGPSGAGCANSSGTGGVLSANGSSTVGSDTVILGASQCPPGTTGLFFSGPTALAGVPLGDGLRCVGGSLLRLQVVTTGPTGSVESGVQLSVAEGLLGGESRIYQYWFRDLIGPCGQGFNATNAVQLQW